MAALMRDWIGPAVQRQLEVTRESLLSDNLGSHRPNIGGALTIHNIHGEAVQINEFISESPPYTVWVTDSYTKIRAVFSKTCTGAFQKTHGRSFSKGTLGAVLVINDFCLAFNPRAPKSQRVMLKIDGFVLQGSEGSANFGQPIIVEATAGVCDFLNKFLATDSNSVSPNSNESHIPASPIHYQSAHSTDEDSPSAKATQAGFNTQAQQSLPKRTSGGGQMESASSRQSLLALLMSRHANTDTAANVMGEISTANHAALSVTQPYPTIQTNGGTCPEPNSFTSGTLQTKPTSFLVPENCTSSSVTEGPYSEQDCIDVEKENGQGVREEGFKLHSATGVILQSANIQLQKRQEKEDRSNLWEGFTRIPRKYVQIPKDQRALLDRNDLWYPFASGNRAANVNVPTKVLLDLQTFHDHHPSQEIISDNTDGHESGETDSGGEGDPELPEMHIEKVSFTQQKMLATAHSAILTSPDGNEESASEGHLSWSSSPISEHLHPVRSESGGEEAQNSAKTPPIEPWLPSKPSISATALSPNTVAVVSDPLIMRNESDSEGCDSERPSSQMPGRNRGTFSARSAGRLTMSLMKNLKPSNHYPSSSPIEMEISVPYGLNHQTRPLLNPVSAGTLKVTQPVQALSGKPQPTPQVERTPLAIHEKRAPILEPLSRLRGTKSNERDIRGENRVSDWSDPVIPGTFDNESAHSDQISTRSVPLRDSGDLEHYVADADHVISATPTSPVQLQVLVSSLPAPEGYLPNSQKNTEAETFSQRTFKGSCVSPLRNLDSEDKTTFPRKPSGKPSDDIMPAISPLKNAQDWRVEAQFSSPMHVSPLDPPVSVRRILSSPTRPIKRRLSHLVDVSVPCPKRRRSVQAAIFGNSPDKKMATDPSEMANANRRKFFLQELSMTNDQHSPSADSELASGAVIEKESEGTTESARKESRNQVESFVESELSNPQCSSLLPRTPFNEKDERLPVINLVRDEFTVDIGKTNKNKELNDSKEPGKRLGPTRKGSVHLSDIISLAPRTPTNDENVAALANLSSESTSEAPPPTLYEMYRTNYLAYDVSERSFNKSCVYLQWLHSKKKAPHPVLWDDFIRTFSDEYISYVRKSIHFKEAAMPAIDFYNTHVMEPVFNDRVVTFTRMADYLLLNREETIKNRGRFFQKPKSEKSQGSTSETPSPLTAGNHLSVASQDNRLQAIRRPFFETASQVGTRDLSIPTEPLEITSPLLDRDEDSEETLHSPGNGDAFPNRTPLYGEMAVQNVRSLPWMSSTPGRLFSKRPRERIRDTKNLLPPGQETKDTESHQASPARGREESPILGCNVPHSPFTAETKAQLESASPSSSNMKFSQDSIFKPPALPVSKIPGRKVTSLPGLSVIERDGLEMGRRIAGCKSRKLEMLQNQTTPILLTFKDFARAYVPRRQRVASESTSISLPKPTNRSDRKGDREKIASTPSEPLTQAWSV